MRRCYRKQSLRLSFFFFSLFPPASLFYLSPHQDEFYQQLQAIRQPWHIPSDTDSDIMEPPEQDKSELDLPASPFLSPSLDPSRTSGLLYLDTAHFIVRRSHLAPPKNMPVPVELGDVRLAGRQPNEFIQ